MIQHEFITLSLAQFGQISRIPYNRQAVFTNEWDLAFFKETEGPYHTNLPTPDEIRRFLQLERVESNRTIKSKNVILTPNQILTKEIRQYMKHWEELIRENVFGLGGHQDHLSASLTYILYYIVFEEQYNLAYFFVKRIECARATLTANLPYGMVMYPLALKRTRKPQNDRGMPKAHHSVSSSSAYHYGSLTHHGNDDEDDGISHASTPSPTTFLNSLSSLNYQKYDIPTSSQKDDDLLFEQQTALLNQLQQMHEEVRGGFKSFRKALKESLSRRRNGDD
nr:ribosomal protein L7Ae/L30e/S12e/Gadd45 [Tanacetum cinerariifolium]